MKKMIFMASALLIGSFAVQAQEDSDMVGTTTTTKTVVQKEVPALKQTTPTTQDEDQMNTPPAYKPNADMKKIMAEREERGAAIRAAKKEANRKRVESQTTGVTKSQAKVVTKEMLEAEKIEKKKKATKKDN